MTIEVDMESDDKNVDIIATDLVDEDMQALRAEIDRQAEWVSSLNSNWDTNKGLRVRLVGCWFDALVMDKFDALYMNKSVVRSLDIQARFVEVHLQDSGLAHVTGNEPTLYIKGDVNAVGALESASYRKVEAPLLLPYVISRSFKCFLPGRNEESNIMNSNTTIFRAKLALRAAGYRATL